MNTFLYYYSIKKLILYLFGRKEKQEVIIIEGLDESSKLIDKIYKIRISLNKFN